ncbi:MAG: rRNA maturation RNase YbeY [Pedobacter sp.]|nr:MAG: rRNA maturation RNase YbeY [Pedobacter sp.]
MPKINYFSEDIQFQLKAKRKHTSWLKDCISEEGFKLSELNFILCSDEYLLGINQDFLQHDYYTDVITFDNSEAPKIILGDIFISLDRVAENALQFGSTKSEELRRIMVHGTLHLLGYRDKTKAAKTEMTFKENYYLQKFTL